MKTDKPYSNMDIEYFSDLLNNLLVQSVGTCDPERILKFMIETSDQDETEIKDAFVVLKFCPRFKGGDLLGSESTICSFAECNLDAEGNLNVQNKIKAMEYFFYNLSMGAGNFFLKLFWRVPERTTEDTVESVTLYAPKYATHTVASSDGNTLQFLKNLKCKAANYWMIKFIQKKRLTQKNRLTL